MKYKKTLFLITLLIYTLFGCDINDDYNTKKESPCYISADCHFSGYINGNYKLFVDGNLNYQKNSGTTMIGGEEPIGRFVFGINTWPINNGDEAIFIHTPKVNTEDAVEVYSKFPIGELTLGQRKEFKLYYHTIIDENSYQSEVLVGKFDENSTMEVCKFELNYNSDTFTQYKVRMIFSCKLYSAGLNGEQKGEIESGEITGVISFYNE